MPNEPAFLSRHRLQLLKTYSSSISSETPFCATDPTNNTPNKTCLKGTTNQALCEILPEKKKKIFSAETRQYEEKIPAHIIIAFCSKAIKPNISDTYQICARAEKTLGKAAKVVAAGVSVRTVWCKAREL